MLADLPLESLRSAVLAGLARLLDSQPAARAHLARHAGKRVAIHLAVLTIAFRIDPDGRPGTDTGDQADAADLAQAAETPRPDCVITLGPELLLGLLVGDRQALAQARVDGDGVLANDLSAALGDFDWGLALRPWLGDILAARTAQGIAAFGRWRHEAQDSLGQAVAEYASYEAGLLADAPSVRGFIADVDELRDAVARLEARLALLERHRS